MVEAVLMVQLLFKCDQDESVASREEEKTCDHMPNEATSSQEPASSIFWFFEGLFMYNIAI
jgi:uncharacterized UBP type Zn finger protein